MALGRSSGGAHNSGHVLPIEWITLMPMPTRDDFMLDPSVVFLNHGSFGACPKPVFEVYQQWQVELERQPVEFMGRRYDSLMNEARAALAAYLNTDVEGLVFVPNATVGINTVARSFPLEADDEILATDHEYGALDYTWQFVCRQTGAQYIRRAMPLPMTTPEAFVEHFWAGVTPKTKVIYISHITSPTALIFPVAEICRRAREAGIISVVDGAHAPSQIPLNLNAIGADVYSGNLHKWLCAPKGSAFLYVGPEYRPMFEPLVISWGYVEDASFVTRNQWQGTRDVACYLSVPAAIQYQAEHDWDAVRARCHRLAAEARRLICEFSGLASISPDSTDWYSQMVTIPLQTFDAEVLKRRLYDEHRVEVPLIQWRGNLYVRVSIQTYNTQADVEALLNGLKAIYQR